jgi:PAS domain S-box-containing protein
MEAGLLAAIVASSADAIISKDLRGIVTSWNPAAEQLLGYSAHEMIGRPISTIAGPGGAAEMAGILARIAAGERIDHYETKRRHKDGSLVEISLTVSPIHDPEGRIIGASKIARDISERRRADERLRLLMNELDHRAKNVLAVAHSMLRLTRADSVGDFVAAVEGRIRALSRVHRQVAENRWEGAELRVVVEGSLEGLVTEPASALVDGPSLWITPAAAQVLGILLHELATNAAKHGALSKQEGSVQIHWTAAPDGGLHLTWREQKGPPVTAPERKRFGSHVIERNVPDQLGGSAKLDWHPLGLQCEFVVPADHLVAAPADRGERTRRA